MVDDPTPAYRREVTSWGSGDGGAGPDVLSQGAEDLAARPGWRFVIALGLLALGALIGARVDDELPWRRAADPAPIELVAGSIAARTGVDAGHSYRIGVFNAGDRSVEVSVVGLSDHSLTVTDSARVSIAPRDWGTVEFTVRNDCDRSVVQHVPAVVVRSAGSDSVDQQIPVTTPPDAGVADDYGRCAAPTPLHRRDLGGLWVLEEAEGRWADLAKVGLFRFSSDGTFIFDPEGFLFVPGKQGFFGTYRLTGSRLVLTSDGGYACGAGHREVWTTTALDRDLLRLDIAGSDPGYCYVPTGDRQVLRRLVPEGRLPTDPAVTDPTR